MTRGEFYRDIQSYIEQKGVSPEVSPTIVGAVRTFAVTALREFPKLTVLGRVDDIGSHHLWLYLLSARPIELIQGSDQMRRLHLVGSNFAHNVFHSAIPHVFAHLEFVSPDDYPPSRFSTAFRVLAAEDQATFLGAISSKRKFT